MKHLLIFFVLVTATGTIFGQEKCDTVYQDMDFYGGYYIDGFELSWFIKNDTTLHSVYIFGENKENTIELIDSVSSSCRMYYIPRKEAEKYKSFFVGYRIGTTLIRSYSIGSKP